MEEKKIIYEYLRNRAFRIEKEAMERGLSEREAFLIAVELEFIANVIYAGSYKEASK